MSSIKIPDDLAREIDRLAGAKCAAIGSLGNLRIIPSWHAAGPLMWKKYALSVDC